MLYLPRSPGLNIPSKSLSEEHAASIERGFESRAESDSIEFESISSDELFEEILTPGFDDFGLELISQSDPALLDQVGFAEDHSAKFEPTPPDELHVQVIPEDHSGEFELISRPWDGDPEFNPNDPNILETTHRSDAKQSLLFFDPSILPSIPSSIKTQMFLEKNLSLVACCIESGDAGKGLEKINPTRKISYELRIRAARDFALIPIEEQRKILLNTLRLYPQILNDVARFVTNPKSFEADFGLMANRAFNAFRTLPKEEQIRLD
jgi:hypothetical protein